MNKKNLIVVINPGSTSTKLGLFREEEEIYKENIKHKEENFRGLERIWEQIPLRHSAIKEVLLSWDFKKEEIFAIVGRGGLLRPVESGIYEINKKMLKELKKAERGEHASNLGAPLSKMFADEYGVSAYIVDPVSVDELSEVARISGLEGIEREALSHVLNTKSVIRRFAKECKKEEKNLRLIVCHLGSGISVSAYENGKIIDVNNSMQEGPFGMDRAGGVPVIKVLSLIEKRNESIKSMKRKLFGEGGVYSYLKTKDFSELLKMKKEENKKACLIYNAMVYQIAKEIGAMATVLKGNVEAVIITGGMAYVKEFVKEIEDRTKFIAPIKIYPGEDELKAMAEWVTLIIKEGYVAKEY